MTHNIETALGVTGVEGIFRLSCEQVCWIYIYIYLYMCLYRTLGSRQSPRRRALIDAAWGLSCRWCR